MSGKIARRLADDINRRRGLQQLQKILRLEDEIFGLIDWESFGPATNTFTKTVSSRAHLCKHVSAHWFTEARAHKFDNLVSDRCQCCQLDVAETTDHILQCPTRDTVHSMFYTKFIELMQEQELPNDILELFDASIDIALFTPLRFSFDEDYIDAADIMMDERVTKILNNDNIRPDRREVFAQQKRMGWTRKFMCFLPLAVEPLQKT